MSYLDVDTGTVATAGNNTAQTSGNWQSWAHNADTAFRAAVSAVKDGTVSVAVEGYATDWNPKLQSIAGRVDALGTNTTSASHVVYNADGTATFDLTAHGAATEAQGSTLRRPIVA